MDHGLSQQWLQVGYFELDQVEIFKGISLHKTAHFVLSKMKWIGLQATFVHIQAKVGQESLVRMVRLHFPPYTGFEIETLEVWGRARYFSVTEAPQNTEFFEWIGEKHSCLFQTAETLKRTPNSSVKGSGSNHYPRVLSSNGLAIWHSFPDNTHNYYGLEWLHLPIYIWSSCHS